MRAVIAWAHPDVMHFLHLPGNEFLVDCHSNSATAAVALPLPEEPIDMTAFRLRRNPVSVKHRLRECSKGIGTVATHLMQAHHRL
jgi:hypothetical protein